MCVVVAMRSAECGSHCDGVGRYVEGYMSVVRALCCGAKGGTAWGPVDRGVLLRRVVIARWSRRRSSVPCRRCARAWFLGMSISLVRCPWCCVRMLGSAYEGAQELGAWPVENRKC